MNNFNFTITDSARSRIEELSKQPKFVDKFLRVSVEGGGCSGFRYNFEFVNEILASDHEIKLSASSVIIDEMSQSLLNECTLEYSVSLGSAAFIVENPRAQLKCGCGSSFSI